MSVRRATDADLGRLVDLSMEVHDLHVAQLSYFFKPVGREEQAAFILEMLAAPEALAFVACEGSAVVGYMLLMIRERPENSVTHAQRLLYIEQIGVTEAHRRQGHAAALV